MHTPDLVTTNDITEALQANQTDPLPIHEALQYDPGVRRPTLDDVAERAGVSRTLVSLTLRGLAGASEETTRTILQAASDLGYVPDASARNLASKSSQSIGVLLNDMHNVFFAHA